MKEEDRAGFSTTRGARRVPFTRLNINIFKLEIRQHTSMERREIRRPKFLTSLKTACYVTYLIHQHSNS
jgi:hypothetical protein